MLNSSQPHRSRPRQLPAQALQLCSCFESRPRWRRLSSQQSSRHQLFSQPPSPSPTAHAWPDATHRSDRVPGPR